MNELQFEQLLRSQQPVAPSAKLAAQIAGELRRREHPTGFAQGPRTEPLLSRLLGGCGWALAGAAACAGLFALNPRSLEHDPVPGNEATYEPAGAVRTLLGAEDDGLVFDADSSPLRQVRYNYLERRAWTNPATGSRVEVEVPREDTFLISVSMQ